MKTINTFYENFSDLSQFIQDNHNTLFAPQVTAVLVQVFSGQCNKEFLIRISSEITQLVPGARVIGTTTSGSIINGEVSGLKTVLSITVFNKTTLNIGFFLKRDLDEYELGRSVVAAIDSRRAKILIMFATGISNANLLLNGFQADGNKLPIAGGIAGKIGDFNRGFVFCDGQVTNCGVVAAILESEDLIVKLYSHLGWQPIGKQMTVTKAEGSRVYTIDGIPAYEVYRKYLGLDKADNFHSVMEFPLIAKRNRSYTAKTPIVLYEDDSIGFAAEVAAGEKFRFSFGHVGLISEKIQDLCAEIKQQPVESIFVYSCESRRGFLQDLSWIETEPLQEIAPTSGFYTHGEFFYDGETNHFLNAMMTVLVMSESEWNSGGSTLVKADMPKGVNEYKSSVIDSVAVRNLGVLKALTNLANTVTAELISINEELQHISLHDSLTGLFNRAFFEQEIKQLDATSGTVGIIICDLDHLKILNDRMGHDFGDQIIRQAAELLKRCCPVESIVARIGGDEFVILVPDANLMLLKEICNRILVEAKQSSNLNNCLFFSVGYAIREPGRGNSMADTFKIADGNMYRNKLANKQSRRQKIIRSLKDNHH